VAHSWHALLVWTPCSEMVSFAHPVALDCLLAVCPACSHRFALARRYATTSSTWPQRTGAPTSWRSSIWPTRRRACASCCCGSGSLKNRLGRSGGGTGCRAGASRGCNQRCTRDSRQGGRVECRVGCRITCKAGANRGCNQRCRQGGRLGCR
jgi:hypothetical protein